MAAKGAGKKSKAKAKKTGRPSKYEGERFCVVARSMARLGATDEEIAEALGVSVASLGNWKKIPEFLGALKEGKAQADSHVEEGLYRRAIGYEYTETKVVEEAHKTGIALNKDGKLTPAIVVRTETMTKQRAPDVTAQIFWLKNRKPAEWRDVQHQEVTGKDGGPVEFSYTRIRRKLLPEVAS